MGTRRRWDGPGNLWLRQFGEPKEDLEIDFGLRPRPLLETTVLSCCAEDDAGNRLDDAFFWQLEIGARIELLATIAALDGVEELAFRLRCPSGDCGQVMESELTLREIAEARRRAVSEPTKPLLVSGESFSIRRPTGTDQLSWLRTSYPDPASATRFMMETLLDPARRDAFRQIARADDTWVEIAEEAMEERDPLVHATISVDCPYCGAPVSSSIDLAGAALDRLRQAQRDLMDTIHLLASRYHWSEQEIFDIPPWRRSRYRARLEQGPS